MKKVLSIVISLCIVLTLFSGISVLAENTGIKAIAFSETPSESPIEYIEPIDDVLLGVNSMGYESTDANGKPYYHYSYYGVPSFTMHLKDGSVLTQGVLYYNGDIISPEYSDNQYTEHWVEGGRYPVTMTIAGITTTFYVKITSPTFKSIVFDDMVLYENTSGYYSFNNYSYTATLLDDTVIKGKGDKITVNDREFIIYHNDNQSENPFYAGNTYEVPLQVDNIHTTVNVSIKKVPIERIEFDDVTVNSNNAGTVYPEDEEPYTYYNYNHPGFVVYFNDGRPPMRVDGGDSFTLDGNEISVNANDHQTTNHWKVGETYTVDVEILGVKAQYKVTVQAPPITAISVKDIEIIENTGGNFTDGNYRYDLNGIEYEVTLKDGKKINTRGGVEIDGEYYSLQTFDNQYSEPWVVGNTYEVTAKIGEVTDTFNVKIIESPVKSVEFPDIEYIIDFSAYSSFYNNDFSLTLENGDKLTSDEEHSIIYNNKRYDIEGLDFDVDPDLWKAGNTYTGTGYILGKEFTFNVNTLQSPFTAIEISGDNELTIKFIKDSGDFVTEKATGFGWRGIGQGTREGYLSTENGVYMATVYFKEEENSVPNYGKNVSVSIGSLKSNELENCNWFKAQTLASDYAVGAMVAHTVNGAKDMTRTIYREDDITFIVSVSLMQGYIRNEIIDGTEYSVIDRNILNEGIKEYFGINDFDFTKTAHYNSEKPNEIYVRSSGFGGMYVTPEIEYKDNEYKLTMIPQFLDVTEDYEKIVITADNEFKIKNIEYVNDQSYSVNRGDANGDGVITDQDAIYTLFSYYYPDKYPSNQDYDFDGNETFNDQDAIYLLFHYFYPDKYPLK
ncbi:MAG: hypothetical protein IKF53_05115 [Clostridia bacterium]|nr:hypothetical protein [Clostridia bacterium]